MWVDCLEENPKTEKLSREIEFAYREIKRINHLINDLQHIMSSEDAETAVNALNHRKEHLKNNIRELNEELFNEL